MKHLHMSALQLIKTGDVSSAVGDNGDSMAGKGRIWGLTLIRVINSIKEKVEFGVLIFPKNTGI